MRKEKGITLIGLVIIIIAVGVVIFSGFKYAQKYIDNQEKEDIKANMLAIESVVTHINNKRIVDEANNPLIGIKLDIENSEYEITEQLKIILLNIENANFYILNETDLNNMGIKEVTVSNKEFYIVDYNSGEIFYSLGIDGKYKLSEI